jgi:hypothetical protein
MAKAHITTPDGVNVKLDGTPAEIAAVLKEVSSKSKPGVWGTRNAKGQRGKVTIPSLVAELKDEGFFKKTKTLGDIKKRLGELGHNYPLTTLSGVMQGEAKKRRLRRFKQNGKYIYAQ